MKDKLGGTVMKEFVALRPEMYSYLTDNGYVDKKAKSTRKCMTKSKTKFKNQKNSKTMKKYEAHSKGLEVNQTMYSLAKSTKQH